MAKHTVIELIDDLDGSAAAETVRFALDGAEYEIDLADGNAEELRNALAPYVNAGRRHGKAPARTSSASGIDAKTVRRWAVENGIEVGTMGRVPTDVVKQYQAAQN